MEYTNSLSKYIARNRQGKRASDAARTLVLLVAPFAPHFAEEMWESFGEKDSVFNQRFPICDESALVLDEVEIPLQINGKVRARFNVQVTQQRKTSKA